MRFHTLCLPINQEDLNTIFFINLFDKKNIVEIVFVFFFILDETKEEILF